MRLIQKEGTEIISANGHVNTECVIEAIDLHIDKKKTAVVKIGIFANDGTVEEFPPVKELTWIFTKEPLIEYKPLTIDGNVQYDSNLDLIYTDELTERSHVGSPFIMYTMDILKPTDSPTIITPKILASQLWILNQWYDRTRKIGDLFEFENGLLPE